MKNFILILMIISSISSAKIIEGKPTWGITTQNNAIYGAYCDMKFDTYNGNYRYKCKGVKLSEFNVTDINGFIVGSSYISTFSGYEGHGTIKKINGTPYSFNGSRGQIEDTTSHFMQCEYGYIQSSFWSEECIPKPVNSKYGAYEGASWGYRCNDGYDDIEGQCIKRCKSNQILTEDSCFYIPKHAYKNAYDNFECNDGYEWYHVDGSCIKSCNETEIRNSITNKCESLITKNFKKHCKLTKFNEIIDVTCDKGWDWCKNITDAVKLPKNAIHVYDNCMISECESGYTLNADSNTCIKVDEMEN